MRVVWSVFKSRYSFSFVEIW